MEKIFEGKVAIVTGGSFGIGRATAIAFAKEGAKVVVADWVEDTETVDAIKAAGGEAIFVKCDVSSPEQVENLAQQTIQTFGRIDYGVNNAGIEGLNAPTHECTLENWEKTININLRGVFLCMKYQIAQMLKQGGGAIVNVASIAGMVGFAGLPAYVASKHGVAGLTKAAALEVARNNIRINVVCPGVIKTPMVDRVTGKDKTVEKMYENAEPIGRMGQPEEVADSILYLCSNKASFITGAELAVDGGWVAQ